MESALIKRRITKMEGSSASDVGSVNRPGTGAATSTSEQGSGRWLDAFTVALGQASEGKWYVSTLNLELASFEACAACRGVRTLRVTVDKDMPLSLWGEEDPFGRYLGRTETRRLPALRAYGVAWKMPAGMLVPVLSKSILLRGARWMKLTGVDCGQLDFEVAALSRWDDSILRPATRLVHSPRSYFEAMLAFLGLVDPPINTIRTMGSLYWPSALRHLSLGCLENERVDWAALPSSLERLALGGKFDQPIGSVTLPASLEFLTLGGLFNQRVEDVVWPASLLSLTLGDSFDQPIARVRWPGSMRKLTFGDSFDQSITDVVWPTSLLILVFGETFNRPVARVKFPAGLELLAFIDSFDQPIDDVEWPDALVHMCFGYSFDQPIDSVVWPASLKWLEFGELFNQPITQVAWPNALQQLTLGHAFDESIIRVKWPASLRRLTLSDHLYDLAMEMLWPRRLEVLFTDEFYHQDQETRWPFGQDIFDHHPHVVLLENM